MKRGFFLRGFDAVDRPLDEIALLVGTVSVAVFSTGKGAVGVPGQDARDAGGAFLEFSVSFAV